MSHTLPARTGMAKTTGTGVANTHTLWPAGAHQEMADTGEGVGGADEGQRPGPGAVPALRQELGRPPQGSPRRAPPPGQGTGGGVSHPINACHASGCDTVPQCCKIMTSVTQRGCDTVTDWHTPMTDDTWCAALGMTNGFQAWGVPTRHGTIA